MKSISSQIHFAKLQTGVNRRAACVARIAALPLMLMASACAYDHRTLRRFEAVLANHDSATAALASWCVARNIANPPTILAHRNLGEMLPPTPEIRALLAVGATEPVRYRHVRLSCGDATLSLARNWYIPNRLTTEMNAALDSSDVPFGKVVMPLHFVRERLTSVRGRAEGCPRGTVLSHRALLRVPDGRPISLVVECYTKANVGG